MVGSPPGSPLPPPFHLGAHQSGSEFLFKGSDSPGAEIDYVRTLQVFKAPHVFRILSFALFRFPDFQQLVFGSKLDPSFDFDNLHQGEPGGEAPDRKV